MKQSISIITAIISVFQLTAQTLPANGSGYPTGTYKREQRVITTFINSVNKPNNLKINVRSVGKCYVANNAAAGYTNAEYTYTEISGIRKEDGKVIDMGNPIEDKTNYAYKVVYNNQGTASSVEGRTIYMDAVTNDNLHDLTEGAYFHYFLHDEKPRSIGETWTDDHFSYPLTGHIPMTLKFEKIEKTPEGKTAAKLLISGDVELKDHWGMVIDEAHEMNMKGSITGYIHVDPNTKRVLRIKSELTMKGDIIYNDKPIPYEIEMKIREWEMNPKGK